MIAQNHIDDDFYERLSKYFSDEAFAYLIAMINQINVWNRFSIATQKDIDKDYK